MGCRNSLYDALRIALADLRKIIVMSKPTTKSGSLDCVRATRPAAKRTLVFAIISLREHTHVECIFKSSVLCLAKRNRQVALAPKASAPIKNMRFDSGVPPAMNL